MQRIRAAARSSDTDNIMSLDLLSLLIVAAASLVLADVGCFFWLRSIEPRSRPMAARTRGGADSRRIALR
jgi:hypothetical protein